MNKYLLRKRLSMTLCLLGVLIIVVDLMLTRDFFTHIGGLMIASILCFTLGLFIDYSDVKDPDRPDQTK